MQKVRDKILKSFICISKPFEAT